MLVAPEFFRHFSYNLRAVPGSETGSMSLLGNIGHQEITADASASGSSGVGKATSGTFTRVFARVQGGRTVTCRLHWLLGGTWWATFLMRLMKRIQWIWGCNPFFQKGHTHIYVCMYIWLYIYIIQMHAPIFLSSTDSLAPIDRDDWDGIHEASHRR